MASVALPLPPVRVRGERPDCAESASEMLCKIASNKAERTAAFRLVYENYVSKRMIPENVYRLRVTDFHLLPTSTLFVAVWKGEVMATVTLIADGPLGLPMDRVQPELVERLRERRRVAEVSCLSFRRSQSVEFLPVFIEMTRLMAQFARGQGIDQFLIGCVPRHAKFYCRFLGFDQIGDMRPYSTVCNTIGVACGLDFQEVDQRRPDCYERYFGTRLPVRRLQPCPMTSGERDAFAHVIEVTDQPMTWNS